MRVDYQSAHNLWDQIQRKEYYQISHESTATVIVLVTPSRADGFLVARVRHQPHRRHPNSRRRRLPWADSCAQCRARNDHCDRSRHEASCALVPGLPLMAIPGVGQPTAPAFVAAIDKPERFRRSRDVGAYLGLVSRRYQSGEAKKRAWRRYRRLCASLVPGCDRIFALGGGFIRAEVSAPQGPEPYDPQGRLHSRKRFSLKRLRDSHGRLSMPKKMPCSSTRQYPSRHSVWPNSLKASPFQRGPEPSHLKAPERFWPT
jgi:hypothetical protein